jgi:hypothetical protein
MEMQPGETVCVSRRFSTGHVWTIRRGDQAVWSLALESGLFDPDDAVGRGLAATLAGHPPTPGHGCVAISAESFVYYEVRPIDKRGKVIAHNEEAVVDSLVMQVRLLYTTPTSRGKSNVSKMLGWLERDCAKQEDERQSFGRLHPATLIRALLIPKTADVEAFLPAHGYYERKRWPGHLAYDFKKPAAQCAQCGQAARQMCGRCNKTPYCSRECQQSNWHTEHRAACVQSAPAPVGS